MKKSVVNVNTSSFSYFQKRLPANAHAHRDVFQADLPWKEIGEVKQRKHFYNYGDTICHPKSGYVTAKLHGTSTCRCNNNAIFSERAIFKFPADYVCRPR